MSVDGRRFVSETEWQLLQKEVCTAVAVCLVERFARFDFLDLGRHDSSESLSTFATTYLHGGEGIHVDSRHWGVIVQLLFWMLY